MNKLHLWFAGLGEPTRIRVIYELAKGSINVKELAKAMNVEMVNISHHLQKMRESALIESEKLGRFVFYKLSSAFRVEPDGTIVLSVPGLAEVRFFPQPPTEFPK